MTEARIAVFLADDNAFVREGVRALLAREFDLEVVGIVGNSDGLLAGAEAAASSRNDSARLRQIAWMRDARFARVYARGLRSGHRGDLRATAVGARGADDG